MAQKRRSIMRNWLGKLLCIIAILGILDGHLMLAQTWAWMTMLQDRAPTEGVVEAIDSTFSGDSPCPLCCAVTKERQEKDQEAPIPESKPTAKYLPAECARSQFFGAPVGKYIQRTRDGLCFVMSWRDGPPSPPPQEIG